MKVLVTRRSRNSRLSILIVAAICAVCLGCGAAPGLVPVSGLVQHEGQPLTGGKIVFISVEQQKPAAGQIRTDGSFELTTRKAGDGAAPGTYRVTVVTDLNVRGKQVHVTCQAPQDGLMTVEPGKDNHFDINISRAERWTQMLDD